VLTNSQNTSPLQLPIITIDPRQMQNKAKSRLDAYKKKMKRVEKINTTKYLKAKQKNKSFVEARASSKKSLLVSRIDGYKSSCPGAENNKDIRHKSVERQELFDKHFTNVF